MRSTPNSYHVVRDKEGFVLYSRIKCCAMCEFCSTRTEYRTPIMSMDGEDIAVQVTYCTRRDIDTIEDTGVIPEWCPIIEILDSRDSDAGAEMVYDIFKSIFPQSQ